MKKYTLLFLAPLFLCTAALAQNVVPNGTFENWDSATYFSPKYSIQSSNPTLFYAGYDSFNCQRVTDAYHGSYALKLTTVLVARGDTALGFFTDGNANNDPATWTGGIPITSIPTGARGYYKSAISSLDSGVVFFDFRSGGVSVGFYKYKFGGVHDAYTPFSFTFNPAISVTPDSVVFGASSSDLFRNKMSVGSMLQLDSISLTGLVSQPVQLNGDFELWNSTFLSKPANWYDPSNQYIGISRTTDAESGTYAIELKTTAGNRGNQPLAIPAVLSTGFFECQQGNGPCMPKGGCSFTNPVDTLAFYYKYIPSGNDTAEVQLHFKKNGVVIGGINPLPLLQSNNYSYMEIPFFVGQAPDTALITFQSSLPGDSLLSFVGSDLKIDSVHFKVKAATAPSGIKTISDEKELLIYPNPSSDGTFTISGIETGEQVRIFNMLGEEVNAHIIGTNSIATIQMPVNASGIYFVEVFSKDKVATGKVILNRN